MNIRKSQNQPLPNFAKSEYAIEQSDDDDHRQFNHIQQTQQLEKSQKFSHSDQNKNQQLVSRLQNFSQQKYELQNYLENKIIEKQSNNKLQHKNVQQQNYQDFEANEIYPHISVNQYNSNPNYKQIEESQDEQNSSINEQNQKKIGIKVVSTSHNQAEKSLIKLQQVRQIQKQQKHQGTLKRPQLIQYCQNDDIEKTQLTTKSNQNGQVKYSLKFKKYSFQYFLRIQTQVFIIEVSKTEKKSQTYFIKRRFSDFAFLYQSIFINHLGYILYPFPEKNLQTFIKLKLNLNNKNQGQKIELIQKRMLQLQKFINFLIQHQQLHYSEELIIFLQSDEIFQKNRKRIQSYIEQYKQLESYSTIKSLIQKGASFIASYLRQKQTEKKPYSIRQQDKSFELILETVRNNIQKLNKVLEYAKQLYQVQSQYSEFIDIETDIDDLLRLCAKHSSGKQYSKQLANWLLDYFIQILSFRLRSFKQIQSQLIYRLQLSQLNRQLQDRVDYKQKNQKIKRRIDRFQKNFSSTWGKYIQQFQREFQKSKQDFLFVWKNHQANMCKIWSQQKKKQCLC